MSAPNRADQGKDRGLARLRSPSADAMSPINARTSVLPIELSTNDDRGIGNGVVEAKELLKTCSLFSDLSDADLASLASHMARRNFEAGKAIFYAGDTGDSLFGIIAGEVRISRPAADGSELIIVDFDRGHTFGELSLLDGGLRSADAVAITNCDLLVLARRNLIPFMRQRPELCLSLLKLVSEKLRIADERSSDFMFLGLSARLAKCLLRLCVPSGAGNRPGRTSLTQGELARIVGGTRPNVNRQLKEWERRGNIEMSKGWIIVRDRASLGAATGMED